MNSGLHRNREWLEEQVAEGFTITEIANLAGVSICSISNWCKKFEIKLDSYAKLRKTGEWDNPEWLRSQHWDLQRSIRDIAKEVGLANPNLLERFKLYGIPIRDNTTANELRLDKQFSRK